MILSLLYLVSFDSFSLLVLWFFSITYWKNKDKLACGVMDYG
jgi:hypothetical protein